MRIHFRKALALMISLLMLCTLLPLSTVSVSAATLVSTDFEDGTTSGWSSGCTITPVSGTGSGSSYALLFDASGADWANIYRYVSVEQNTDYVISFKMKSDMAHKLSIKFQTSDWTSVCANESVTPTTSWADYSVTLNSGNNTTVVLTIQTNVVKTVGQQFWLDDIVMEKYEEPVAPPSTSENLVTNGSFENGNTGWALNSNGSIVSGGQDGSYALQMQNPTTQYAAIAVQYVAVEPGTGYTLSWWSKRTAGTGVFNLYMDGATKTAGGNAWMTETSGQWVQTVMDIKTADNATSLMLKFSNEAANTNGTILIDNVVLTKHPEASFDGFLYNGDFEIGSLINWTAYGQTVASTEAAHSGSYGAKLVNPAGVDNWNGVLYQNSVGVEAGKTYTVSMWLKTVQQGVNLQVKDGGTSGANLASKWFTTTSWTKLEWTVTPSTNVLCLNFNGGGTGSQEIVYLDDVMIVEEKDPSFDGYIYNGDFETGKANYWSVYQSTDVSTEAKYEGNFGMKLAGSGYNYGGLLNQTFSGLKVGKTYNVTLMLKVLADGVNVQITSGGSTLVGKYYATNNAADWTEVTLTFTATATTAMLNICGSGNNVAVTAYVDNVTCVREGGEVFPEELHKFGGNSIKENADGIGLAFKFDIKASNGRKNYSNEYVSKSAKITLDEVQYDVVRMGAVMTNNASVGQSSSTFNLEAVDGGKTINVEGKYLAGLTSDTVSFAVRILDIPERHQGTEIYARPYYVYVENGQEIVVYGDIKSNTYAKVANPKSSIKILSIGHSFSKDVMDKYLWDMFKEGGYDEVIIGYLYMAGCSMPKHLYNIQNNLAQYEYGKNTNGTWVKKNNATALSALKDEEWDYVNIQSSPDFIGGQTISSFNLGVNSEGQKITLSTPMTEYECITPITDWIQANATNSSVKTDYHMIWSFSEDCELWSYTYHNWNQMTMYNNIITQTKLNVVPHDAVYNIIPCGTSIQNARTSFIGDNFNEPVVPGTQADGYHLNSKYGDYTAALTWYCHYSGDNANVMAGYIGQLTEAEFDAIAEAVNNAIDTWDEITESTHK